MIIAVTVVIAAVLLLAIGALLTTRTRLGTAAPPDSVVVQASGARATVNVDIDGVPNDPAVSRLIDDLARRAFSMLTTVDELEFRGRDGRVLGVRARPQVVSPKGAATETPFQLLEPHVRLRGGTVVPDAERADHAHPHYEAPDVKTRPLADRFALPPEVRTRLTDPDDPRAIVAAILGVEPAPVMRVGNHTVIVLPEGLGEPVLPSALNHAFHLFERSGARLGLVVTAGHLYRQGVRRREALAPNLQHVGPDGIQRMADAVALGADPFHFARPTQLTVIS